MEILVGKKDSGLWYCLKFQPKNLSTQLIDYLQSWACGIDQQIKHYKKWIIDHKWLLENNCITFWWRKVSIYHPPIWLAKLIFQMVFRLLLQIWWIPWFVEVLSWFWWNGAMISLVVFDIIICSGLDFIIRLWLSCEPICIQPWPNKEALSVALLTFSCAYVGWNHSPNILPI